MEAEKIEEIKNKPLHGQFFRELDKQGIDKEATMWWLNKTGLKGETESLLVAGQDQVLKTRYYQKHILKFPVSSVCRICHKAEEHINHLIAGCSALAPNEYLERHNKVASYIHWTTCRQYQIPVEDKYYNHTPQKVVKKGDVTILWDLPIITDRTIMANKPDVVVLSHRDKKCLLIEVSIPEDRNVLMKEIEKIHKYRDSKIEVSRMWRVKTKTVPVVVGA